MPCSEISYTVLQNGDSWCTLFYISHVSTIRAHFVRGSDLSQNMKWCNDSLGMGCFSTTPLPSCLTETFLYDFVTPASCPGEHNSLFYGCWKPAVCLNSRSEKKKYGYRFLTRELYLNERRKPCEGEMCDRIMGPLFLKLFDGLGDMRVALSKRVVLLTVFLASP